MKRIHDRNETTKTKDDYKETRVSNTMVRPLDSDKPEKHQGIREENGAARKIINYFTRLITLYP
jgi:hypothetical protein